METYGGVVVLYAVQYSGLHGLHSIGSAPQGIPGLQGLYHMSTVPAHKGRFRSSGSKRKFTQRCRVRFSNALADLDNFYIRRLADFLRL